MNSINGSYILICLILMKFVLMFLFSIVFACFSISFILKILPKAAKDNGLILCHNFAQDHGSVQLWSVRKHNLFLNAPSSQRSSSDVLVRKINLNIPVVVFNAVFIVANRCFLHGSFFMRLYNLFKRFWLPMPFYSEFLF